MKNCVVDIEYAAYNRNGDCLRAVKQVELHDAAMAAFLIEAHAAARFQDQKWISSILGQPSIMGPIERIDFAVGLCFCTEYVTSVMNVSADVDDYVRVSMPHRRTIGHTHGRGEGRFSKFTGW